MCIVNGRKSGDENGEFTFISNKGSSVVDYIMINYDSFDLISQMEVGPDLGSAHLPVSAILNIGEKVATKRENAVERRGIIKYAWKENREAEVWKNVRKQQVWLEKNWANNAQKNEPVDLQQGLLEHWFRRILKPMKVRGAKSQIKTIPAMNELKKEVDEKLERYKESGKAEDRKLYLVAKKRWTEQEVEELKREKTEREQLLNDLYIKKDYKEIWRCVNQGLGYKKRTSSTNYKITDKEWEDYFSSLFNNNGRQRKR